MDQAVTNTTMEVTEWATKVMDRLRCSMKKI